MSNEMEEIPKVLESTEVLFEHLSSRMKESLRPKLVGSSESEKRLLITLGYDFEKRREEFQNGGDPSSLKFTDIP